MTGGSNGSLPAERPTAGAESGGGPTTSDLPRAAGQPALRALAAAGYERLDQLAAVGEADLLALHGVGPKAISRLRQALAERGQTFARGGTTSSPASTGAPREGSR